MPVNEHGRALLGGPLFFERQEAYINLAAYLSESREPRPSLMVPSELPLRPMREEEWQVSFILEARGETTVLLHWNPVEFRRELTTLEARTGGDNITPAMDLKTIRAHIRTLNEAHNRFVAEYTKVH